jgi:hypothetical protein
VTSRTPVLTFPGRCRKRFGPARPTGGRSSAELFLRGNSTYLGALFSCNSHTNAGFDTAMSARPHAVLIHRGLRRCAVPRLALMAVPIAPARADVCATGNAGWVGITVGQLQRELDSQASLCDHNAVLSRLSADLQELPVGTRPGGVLCRYGLVNHEDAVRAGSYFAAFSARPFGAVVGSRDAWCASHPP